jgi:hypothetical protein
MTQNRDGEDSPTASGSDGPPAKDSYGSGASPFQPAARRPVLHRLVPVSEQLPDYHGGTLRRDLLAGVTVAALALPAAMAYAELAGLSPVAGLYALLLPTVAYTLFGSSRQLVVGPEGSIAALVAAALVPLAADDPERYASLAALLAVLVGAVFLVARLIRLGWVADYFSRAVLIGYIHGVAVVLIIGQLGKLLGLDIDAQDPLAQLAEVVGELGQLSGITLAVGVACLASLVLLRWRAPKLPGPLLVVIAAIAASAAIGLAEEGVAVVGEIPAGLPGIQLPGLDRTDVLALLPAALGIFFVSFSDEILTARSFAGKRGQHVRADQELTAMAGASLAAGLTQAFPVGASGSRTAVNDQMGGRTQISGLIGAGAIACVLLFLTEPMQYLPKATLGAVIVAAAIGLMTPTPGGDWPAPAGSKSPSPRPPWPVSSPLGSWRPWWSPSPYRSWTWSGAAPPPMTPSWAGWSARVATPTSGSIPGPRSPRACWSTGWTTGCSSPTQAMSRAASAKRSTALPTPCAGWCSTPRRSPTSTLPAWMP